MNVFVATATYQQHVHAQYAVSIARDCLLATKTDHVIAPPSIEDGGLVGMNRNRLFELFVENPIFDVMVFIDSDLGWEPGAIVKLIETPGEIVGGVYPYKDSSGKFPFWPIPTSGPVGEVEVVPGGFLKITRKAAMMLHADCKFPFRHLIEDDVEFGEDISFCKRARRLGIHVYARMDISFDHWGVTHWSGNAMTDLKIPNMEAEHG